MKRHAHGFTLIGLVVTVAIVGILASVAVPLGAITVQRAKEQELRSALRQIRGALDAYKQAVADKRVEARAGGSGYPRTLDELAIGVDDASSPSEAKIYFLRRLPRDPFYPDAAAPPADSWATRAASSPPDAPAEGDDVFDVYSRSEQIGLNGVAYRDW